MRIKEDIKRNILIMMTKQEMELRLYKRIDALAYVWI
jgi:hypothetical protein